MLLSKKYPKSGSLSSEHYFFADLEIVNFLQWIAFMAGSIDKMRKIAKEALRNGSKEKRQNYQNIRS